ncbi:MAG: SAM-dependent methyltransferase [Planctomycetota bacterium]|nr:SAM-dependent methyltransferase [Planctomycetota bacterium]
MSTRLHIVHPDWQAALQDELAAEFPGSQHSAVRPGWITSKLSASDAELPPSVVFCNQTVPDPVAVQAESVKQWGQLVAIWLIEKLAEHQSPWRLHIYGLFDTDDAPSRGRCELIRGAVLEILKKKQRRLLRSLVTDDAARWQTDEALIQVALTTPVAGYISLAGAETRWQLRRSMSRFAGGEILIPANEQAPARAFAKLAEAWQLYGQSVQPGETCVDLGACPGSWTWLAVQSGAAVTAIDRSELRADLMNNPQVEFLQADAFRYQPPATVDWLLSDIIAFPQRIMELLQNWLQHGWCRQYCVTIKFRGADDYQILQPLKVLLDTYSEDFLLRRLGSNKNEVTAIGIRRIDLP